MTKWRPDGWVIEGEPLDPFIFSNDCNKKLIFSTGYEAGADAMLKALKKEGVHFEKDRWTDDSTFETEVPGTVVFIPDD